MTSLFSRIAAGASALAGAVAVAACTVPSSATTAGGPPVIRPDYVPLTGSAQTVMDPNSVPSPLRIPPNTVTTGFSQPSTAAVPMTGSAQTVRDPNAAAR